MIHGSALESGLWGFAALIAGVFLAARLDPDLAGFTEKLKGRGAVILVTVLGVLAHLVLWGSPDALALVHDEASYLLQAEIFARGTWAVPSPPLPHFFEQFHVLVEPVLAPKYPPGHALLLVPGVWLGLPGLVPLLLNGMTGGLIYALVRRVSDPWCALLAWFLWLIAPAGLAFRPSYFSEVTTGCLMLCAWWKLMDWRESGRSADLVVISLLVAWSAITRPLTAFAFALPIAACVLSSAHSRGLWRQVGVGLVVGGIILLLMPWHSLNTTGDWWLTPYRHYSEVYFPFDVPGFDTTLAEGGRDLPSDMLSFRELYLPYHLAHTWESLPATMIQRVREVVHTTWGSWWPILGVLVFAVFTRERRTVGFAALSFALLIAAYALFAHPVEWVLYYMEAQVVLCMLTALGVWRAARWMVGRMRRGQEMSERERGARVGLVVCALLLVMSPFALKQFESLRKRHRLRAEGQTVFRERVAELPGKSIVFVRYAEAHDIHASLVTNVADLEGAGAWIAHDRGAENLELMRVGSERRAFVYDEETRLMLEVDKATGLAVGE